MACMSYMLGSLLNIQLYGTRGEEITVFLEPLGTKHFFIVVVPYKCGMVMTRETTNFEDTNSSTASMTLLGK